MGGSSVMKANKIKTVKTRRKFDETFKRETLNNWLASGKSAEVVGQELGLTSSRLYAWRKRFAPGTAGGEAAPGAKPMSYAELQAQLEESRREIRHLREQRDILKKTLGILSEPPRNATNGLTR
jgi:transposase-like protein